MAKAIDYVAGIARLYLHKKEASHSTECLGASSQARRVRCLDDSGSIEMAEQGDLLKRSDVPDSGSGKQGLHVMESCSQGGTNLFLGWTPEQGDILQGQRSNTGSGCSSPLFVPGGSNAVALDSQTRKYLRRIGLSDERIDDIDGMTCARVVNYLTYCFDYTDGKIIVNGKISTPSRLLRDLPSISGVLACHIGPVKFLGGPPNATKRLQRGSLRTLLIDAIFVSFCNNTSNFQRFLNVRL